MVGITDKQSADPDVGSTVNTANGNPLVERRPSEKVETNLGQSDMKNINHQWNSPLSQLDILTHNMYGVFNYIYHTKSSKSG